jgi:hypothetical protein
MGGDTAITDEGEMVGDPSGETHLVGDQHEIATFGLEGGDGVEHFGGHFGVERRRGFIEEQEAGFDGQRPGDGDALTLTAGQFVRTLVGMAVEFEPGEQLQRLSAGFGTGNAVHMNERECDVFDGSQVGKQIVGLEDEPGSKAMPAQSVFIAERKDGAIDLDGAGVGGLQTGEKPEQGGFAAAGRSDEDEGMDIPEFEVDLLEHGSAVEGFGEIMQAEVHGSA